MSSASIASTSSGVGVRGGYSWRPNLLGYAAESGLAGVGFAESGRPTERRWADTGRRETLRALKGLADVGRDVDRTGPGGGSTSFRWFITAVPGADTIVFTCSGIWCGSTRGESFIIVLRLN